MVQRITLVLLLLCQLVQCLVLSSPVFVKRQLDVVFVSITSAMRSVYSTDPGTNSFYASPALFGNALANRGMMGPLLALDNEGCDLGDYSAFEASQLIGADTDSDPDSYKSLYSDPVSVISVLVRRGGCTFVEKAEVAASLGFSLIIISNNETGWNDQLVTMAPSGESANPSIVALFVTNHTGESLLDASQILQEVGTDAYLGVLSGFLYESTSSRPGKASLALILWMGLTSIGALGTLVGGVSLLVQSRRRRMSENSSSPDPCSKSNAKDCCPDFSKLKLTCKELDEDDVKIFAEDCCAVCLDEYHVGEVASTLSCSHKFHKRCIEQWVMARNQCCPMCKRDLLINDS